MGLVQITPPINPPVTVAEAKQQLALAGKEHDTLVERLALAATELTERYVGRALVTQTWRLTVDRFPSCFPQELILPRPPLVSVSSVKYVDEAGTLQTLAADQYLVTSGREPARIAPAYGVTWPATREQRDAVRVEYVAGYGADSDNVPQAIRHAILLMVGHWFANREAVVTGTITAEVPLAAECLLSAYRTGVNPECYGLAN